MPLPAGFHVNTVLTQVAMATRQKFYHCLIFISLAAALSVVSGCGDTENLHYPLTPDRWWYYQAETTILDKPRQQRLLVSNLGEGEFEGKAVLIQRQSTGRELYFRSTSEGLKRVAVRAEFGDIPVFAGAVTVLPSDLSRGEPWLVRSELQLVESRTFARQDRLRNFTFPVQLTMSISGHNEIIKVPAGRFNNCLRVDGNGQRIVPTDRGNAIAEVFVMHTDWYAPGVGLVKSVRAETTDSPFLKSGYFKQEMLEFGL
jgi:hypothetical protein